MKVKYVLISIICLFILFPVVKAEELFKKVHTSDKVVLDDGFSIWYSEFDTFNKGVLSISEIDYLADNGYYYYIVSTFGKNGDLLGEIKIENDTLPFYATGDYVYSVSRDGKAIEITVYDEKLTQIKELEIDNEQIISDDDIFLYNDGDDLYVYYFYEKHNDEYNEIVKIDKNYNIEYLGYDEELIKKYFFANYLVNKNDLFVDYYSVLKSHGDTALILSRENSYTLKYYENQDEEKFTLTPDSYSVQNIALSDDYIFVLFDKGRDEAINFNRSFVSIYDKEGNLLQNIDTNSYYEGMEIVDNKLILKSYYVDGICKSTGRYGHYSSDCVASMSTEVYEPILSEPSVEGDLEESVQKPTPNPDTGDFMVIGIALFVSLIFVLVNRIKVKGNYI